MSSEAILTATSPPADARLPYGNDPNQFGELRVPKGDGPFPVGMNIHGGFWRAKYDLAHAGHLCAALTSKGIATFNLEYRRVGNKGGGWPGSFEDVVARVAEMLGRGHTHQDFIFDDQDRASRNARVAGWGEFPIT